MLKTKRKLYLALLLFFFSGMSALIYEVLWLKELGLLFGNSSYAMATTLAAFFLGLTAGGYYWGQRVARHNPLRLYGLLEGGVAVCALGYFFLLYLYGLIYPLLFDWFAEQSFLLILVKFCLAITMLFPPAFFMGGTLPVFSHYLVRESAELGRKFALLYAVNTLGAVFGVFLAGFLLPGVIGYNKTYSLALSITLLIAVAVLWVARSTPVTQFSIQPHRRQKVSQALPLLAFLSGLLTLGLQVLWGRMFAQVLQNSVYTFSLILIIFLFCLALSGFIANRLMYSKLKAEFVLFVVLLMGAFLVALSPFSFVYLTDNLHYLGANRDWPGYLRNIAGTALVVMAGALLFLGIVFPLLIKLGERSGEAHGYLVGRLAAYNTAGAISGSLLAGFVLLDQLGLWAGIRLIAVLYFLLAGYWLLRCCGNKTLWMILPAFGILLSVSVLDPGRLPVVKVEPVIDEESVLQVWEGSAATVAVIRRKDQLKIKVNNYYTLGGTGSAALERLQAGLPLQLYQAPQSVYLLGLGTGITAGGVLAYPVKHLLVTELLSEVVQASDKYFGAYTNGLFYDPRVQIIPEDGRNYLRGSNAQFDVIISDLFVPWKAGTGNLYSLEHYQQVWRHLSPGGIFMQWLPGYQLSADEFKIILRTMLEVFPQVTVWRGDFSALRPVIGLLGHQHPQMLLNEQSKMARNLCEDQQPVMMHYIGNANQLRKQLQGLALNTDDFPLIEFRSPVTQWQSKSGAASWLAGNALIQFMQQFNLSGDPYIAQLDKQTRHLALAGLHLQTAQLYTYQGKLLQAKKHMQLYREYER